MDFVASLLLAYAGTPVPLPPPSPAPALLGPGNIELLSFTIAIATVTVSAVLLGLIAGTAVYVIEVAVLRKVFNQQLTQWWVNARLRDDPAAAEALVGKLIPRWYTLPPKQFAGAIAAAFQSIEVHEASNPESAAPGKDRSDIRSEFAAIGRKLLGAGKPPSTLEDETPVEAQARRVAESLYYAERALDDFQAQLSARWTLGRIVAGAIVVVLLSGLVALVHAERTLGFFGAMVTYPMIWVVAALFASIFRDLVESLSTKRA